MHCMTLVRAESRLTSAAWRMGGWVMEQRLLPTCRLRLESTRHAREWCDPDVLQQVRRKTLARLRREVVPAEQHTFVRLLTRWQGVAVPRRGLDALLDTIEILQGAALPASALAREILPARVLDYSPND